MATVTTMLDVNAPFLHDIKTADRRLHNLLAALRPLSQRWTVLRNHPQRLVQLVCRLRDQLAMHFALEEAFGYFESAVDAAPRLADRAGALRDEHARLFETLRGIAEEGEQLRADRSLRTGIGALAKRFLDFDRQFRDHEIRESLLMLDALEEDEIGVCD